MSTTPQSRTTLNLSLSATRDDPKELLALRSFAAARPRRADRAHRRRPLESYEKTVWDLVPRTQPSPFRSGDHAGPARTTA